MLPIVLRCTSGLEGADLHNQGVHFGGEGLAAQVRGVVLARQGPDVRINGNRAVLVTGEKRHTSSHLGPHAWQLRQLRKDLVVRPAAQREQPLLSPCTLLRSMVAECLEFRAVRGAVCDRAGYPGPRLGRLLWPRLA